MRSGWAPPRRRHLRARLTRAAAGARRNGMHAPKQHWTLEEIEGLDVRSIAAEPCFLFIWCGSGGTNIKGRSLAHLDQARLLLRKWYAPSRVRRAARRRSEGGGGPLCAASPASPGAGASGAWRTFRGSRPTALGRGTRPATGTACWWCVHACRDVASKALTRPSSLPPASPQRTKEHCIVGMKGTVKRNVVRASSGGGEGRSGRGSLTAGLCVRRTETPSTPTSTRTCWWRRSRRMDPPASRRKCTRSSSTSAWARAASSCLARCGACRCGLQAATLPH